MSDESKPRDSLQPYQRALIIGALLALALGVLGWAQAYPDARWDEWVYRSLILFGLAYDLPAQVSPPLALNLARFLAFLVLFGAALAVAIRILDRHGALRKARRCREHIVVLGNSTEVVGLALNYRKRKSRGMQDSVVVVGEQPQDAELQLRAEGIVLVPAASDDSLRRILQDAKEVIVAAATDQETAKLATRVGSLFDNTGFPTKVLFAGRQVAQQWNRTGEGTALCKTTQLAIATLRICPPRLDDSVSPPPIVVGDCWEAAEIARQAVVGWQQLGERMTVHCVGIDRSWVDEAASGIEDRSNLLFIPTARSPQSVVHIVDGLLSAWVEPPASKATSSGPAIIVAVADPTEGFPVAAAVAEAFPSARVAALVDDIAVWQQCLDQSPAKPVLISQRGLLTDPAVLALTSTAILADQLLLDASRWPDEVPTLFGTIDRGPSGSPELARQSDEAQQAIRAVAEGAESILRAAGVEVRGCSLAQEPTIILDPEELLIVRDAILAVLPDAGVADRQERALELASRLPTLTARAGWTPHRALGKQNLLSDNEIGKLARQAHEAYQRTAQRTANATGSAVAEQSWDDLSAFNQESNRAQIVDAPVKLALAGLSWRRAEVPRLYTFSDDQVEYLAEWEHRRWEHHQRRNGRPDHQWAKPWAQLTDDVKEYDRDSVRRLPAELAGAGIEIVDR
ncbi:MAG: hypothetical protein VB040_03460 [Propionibacterium sp.]|nr:hypothetical protein [Propionibacterium sp.]